MYLSHRLILCFATLGLAVTTGCAAADYNGLFATTLVPPGGHLKAVRVSCLSGRLDVTSLSPFPLPTALFPVCTGDTCVATIVVVSTLQRNWVRNTTITGTRREEENSKLTHQPAPTAHEKNPRSPRVPYKARCPKRNTTARTTTTKKTNEVE